MVQKILVCGGRKYSNSSRIKEILEAVLAKHPTFSRLIHGGASGADKLAGLWADSEPSITATEYPANWDRDGRAAGFIRNQAMLSNEKPDAVIAFPGGSGTAHMAKIAKAANIPVWEIK